MRPTERRTFVTLIPKIFALIAISISVSLPIYGGPNVASVPVPNTPAPGSAVMTPSVEAINGGARVTANFHHNQLGSPVSLSIQGIVVDDQGVQHLVELKQIDNAFKHSATDYHTTRSYDLNYDQINQELKAKAPNANLKIGAGTELFLFARWMNVPNKPDMYDSTSWATGTQWNHYYGGPDRQGKFTLPAAADAKPGTDTGPGSYTGSGFTKGGVTTALDVANSVTPQLAAKYPGLKSGGSIGSRFENELKLEVPLAKIPTMAKALQDLAADPAKVEAQFGKGWTMTENRKYVGQPMIDVYLDNEKYDGASIGMALRFRTGAGVTSLNYKPDDGQYMGKAVTARIEYQIEGVTHTADIKVFMDSDDPTNPLQLIREKLKGVIPSDFTIQAVNITDERLKFQLKSPTGDEVEFSLDHVKARAIDKDGKMHGPQVEFGQLEVEVDHLGVRGSTNVGSVTGTLDSWKTIHGADKDTFLKNLNAGANMDQRVPPRFHGEKDFEPNSPIRTANASNFQLAYGVFDKVRDVFTQNGIEINLSGQKYAMAAGMLGLVGPDRYAPTVKQAIKEKLKENNPTLSQMEQCLQAMGKITQM